jgi:hydrogenase nickel insertion protein HypA
MHELSITKALLDLVIKECEEHNAVPKTIVAELGSFTAYKKESILFYFDLLSKDLPLLKNAKLNIKEVKCKLHCNACKKDEYLKDPYDFFCSSCQSTNTAIIQGKEFKVIEIKTN